MQNEIKTMETIDLLISNEEFMNERNKIDYLDNFFIKKYVS